jgi:deazaflavin-dependent oxidoreductase (nitroreductase family)
LALMRHVGRRTGKPYETPVIAERTEDGFVIPIAYGTDSDWYHNVIAAGRGKIVWRG